MAAVNNDSSEYYHQFVNFYESCLAYEETVSYEERVNKVLETVAGVGEFHSPDSWPGENVTHLTLLITRLMQLHSTPLFDVLLDVSAKGRGTFALRLSPPVHRSILLDVAPQEAHFAEDTHCRLTTKPTPPAASERIQLSDYYENYLKCKSDAGQYLQDVRKSLTALRVFQDLPEYNRTKMFDEISAMLEESISIRNKHFLKAGNIRQSILSKNYTIMSISDLQGEFTMVEWRELFTALMGTKLPDSTKVQVYFPDFFRTLFMDLLGGLELRQLNNGLLGVLAHELYAGLVAPRFTCDRPRVCLTAAKALMEDVASLLYMASFSDLAIKQFETEARSMFERSRSVFREELNKAAWLQPTRHHEARTKLLAKLETMELNLGVNGAAIRPADSMAEVPSGTDHLDTFIALQRRLRRRMYRDYSSDPFNVTQLWSQFSTPLLTGGTAIYALNAILIPLAAFSQPFFKSDTPSYIKMSTLGTHIIHEMAHHFDKVGVMYGKRGAKDIDLLISQTAKFDYQEMQDCGDGEYNFPQTHTTESEGIVTYKVPAELSRNERMADQTAVYLSEHTYRTWLLEDQSAGQLDTHRLLPWLGMSWQEAFYVAHAQLFCSKDSILDYHVSLFEDEHLPPFLRCVQYLLGTPFQVLHYRVNNMMKNSPGFSRAFKCVSGQPMNQPTKCASFPALTSVEAPQFVDGNAH